MAAKAWRQAGPMARRSSVAMLTGEVVVAMANRVAVGIVEVRPLRQAGEQGLAAVLGLGHSDMISVSTTLSATGRGFTSSL